MSQNSQSQLNQNGKTSPQNRKLRKRKNSQSKSDDSDDFRDSLEDVIAEGETSEEDNNNKVVDLKPLEIEEESIGRKSRALKRSIHAAEDFVTKVFHTDVA